MDKRVAAVIVQAHLLKTKRRAVQRLTVMKQKRIDAGENLIGGKLLSGWCF